MSGIVAETIQTLEPLAVEKEIQLENVTPLPGIEGDPIRIRQVLFNLRTNALSHTPPGGKITVGGSCDSQWICLSVTDTGEGHEPDQLASVFNRFYRGDKSRSRETGGSGLGLAIVKAILEEHGGRVEARSKGKRKGSSFLVFLPLNKTAQVS